MTPPTNRHLFVVRMWQEADAVTATIQWRGSVQHTHSTECHYFTKLSELIAFIATHTEDTNGMLASVRQQETCPSAHVDM
ncbi:MAG: hypothetical protein KDE31_37065 [Caldilineaceae bacterium]|nr:hypothetical protein [Caldilineaceae bacterium]